MNKVLLFSITINSMIFCADPRAIHFAKCDDRYSGGTGFLRGLCRGSGSMPQFRRNLDQVTWIGAFAGAAIVVPLAGPVVVSAVTAAATATTGIGTSAGVASLAALASGVPQQCIAAGAELTRAVLTGVGDSLNVGIRVSDAIVSEGPIRERAVSIAGAFAKGAAFTGGGMLAVEAVREGVGHVSGRNAREELRERVRVDQANQLIQSNREIAQAQRDAAYYSEQNTKMSEQVVKSHDRFGAQLRSAANNPEELLSFPDNNKE